VLWGKRFKRRWIDSKGSCKRGQAERGFNIKKAKELFDLIRKGLLVWV